MRTVLLVNKSTLVTPKQFAATAKALQTQVTRDFAPVWNLDCTVVTEAPPAPASYMQLFLMDDATVANALGYHDLPDSPGVNGETPIGFVFVRTCQKYGDSWTATASHELLEMLADERISTCVEGLFKGRPCVYALEVADPCEADEYSIDGVVVSNFVFPGYFAPGRDGREDRYDFLGRLNSPAPAVTPGGYLSYSLKPGQWQQLYGRRVPEHHKFLAPFGRRHWRTVPY